MTEWLNRKVGFKRDASGTTALDRAEQFARHAIELDPAHAEAYATLAWILHWKQGPLAGVAMFERAFELNPSLANGRFANSLTHAGRATEAIVFLKRVMRLDPFYPPIYDYFLGKSYFYAGRYEESIERLRSVADALPGLQLVLPIYAAAAALAGYDDEAHVVTAELRKVQPDFTIGTFVHSMRLVREEDNQRLTKGLQRAGLPD